MTKTAYRFVPVFLLFSALTSSRAATWYLQAPEASNWNTLSIWFSQPITGGTHPTSISSADDFDLSGFSVETPNSAGTNTFGGAHLILHGGLGGFINCKTSETNSIAIPNLVSYGGFIQNSAGSGNLPIQVTNFVNNSNTTLNGLINGRGLVTAFGTLSGGGDICALGGAGGTTAGGAVIFSATNATAFTGTLYIADCCQFTFNNAMTSGGALDIASSGATVTLNFTVTFKGLTVNGASMSTGTYTAASLGFQGSGSIVVQTPTIVSSPVTQQFGTNLPGGSFATPFYPTDALVWNYLQTKKLNLVRVAFKWEQIQPTLNGALSSSVLSSLDSTVALANARGMQVFLDMHNYDTYSISGTSYLIGSPQVPYSAYQNAWQQIAAHYAGEAGIYGYDIMNEPHGDGGTWFTAAQYGVNGVRQSDTTHYVIVEGDSYAGAQSWMSVNDQLSVTDPANLTIYSAHTYWDSNDSGVYSGTYDSNNDYPNVGIDRVAQFVYWLQLKNYKGLVGEFGVPNNVANPDYRWNQALDNFLNYLNNNGVSGTYWSMTQNGWPDSYALLCATGGKSPGPVKDAPAMSVLETYGGGMLPPPNPTAAVSRKVHGSGGNFDIPISVAEGASPAAGLAPVECRIGNTLSLVVTFDQAVIAGTAVTGAGTATAGAPTFSGSTMTIPLTGVTNGQTLQVNLSNVQALSGGILPSAVVSLRVLNGDVNGDGIVSAVDMLTVRNDTGETAGQSNFNPRADCACLGIISAEDMLVVRNNTGNHTP
jgi:endoglucanase